MRALALALIAVAAACGGKSTTTTPRVDPGPPDAAAKPAAAAPPDADPVDRTPCANRPEQFGPFALDEAQAQRRYGINARTFADAPTTKDRAVEVCGIPASRQWLRGTTCADGSAAQQNGRTGSVGPGGRCGAIIDRYTVTCPERDYEVYIDIYMCGPGESMR
jgi:hypothetical protein